MSDLLVVLNRAEAKFFKLAQPKSTLTFIKAMENPLGRERNRAMQNDKPGADRFKIKGSTVPHSMSGEKDPHEEAAIQFIRKVAEELNLESTKKNASKFVIVSDSHLTGLLNGMLSKNAQKQVSSYIQKNLSKLSEHELSEFLLKQKESEENYG